ncbi:hypothetical protein BSAF29S_06257 [Bacillus safensis subsp. safensis]
MAQFKKAMLIYNGNAGQKNMEKTLGQTVPLLSLHIDELILKPTKQPNDAYDSAVELMRRWSCSSY